MKLIFILLPFLYFNVTAQDIVKTEGITNPLHQANIGRITFMNGNIPLEQYTAADFLDTFELTHQSNLNIRVFMGNSITNYMHQVAPELPLDTLVKSGNAQFAFYIDGKMIYKENLHYGAAVRKNTATTFRVPLTSTHGDDWWALYLWDRFMLNGGERALTDGSHRLRIEIKPYVNTTVGALIAAGELTLKIKTPVLTARDTIVQPIQPGSGWDISTAAFDKRKIEAMNKAIAQYTLKNITSVVVIKDGKLLLEEYFNDADRNTLHDTRSVGKSFTSTMMGIAIKEGYIKNENQTLSAFYNLKQYSNYSPRKDSVKIKDLLTMSSALSGSDAHSDSPGNEDNMYPTDNWVKFALDLPMDAAKQNGAQWDYFTAGIILLGDILNKSVPGGLETYTAAKLFTPMGITKYQWQYTPQHVVNTAGSLQLSSLDYAKYAQLYKNKGVWKGQQLIPADWVARSSARQLQIPERDQEFYGYLFWEKAFATYDTFYCSGNGGNEIIIFKDLPVTVIITSKAYNRPYAHVQSKEIIEKYVLPALYL